MFTLLMPGVHSYLFNNIFRACMQVNNTGVCAFGEKCKYMHDVSEFMKVKPKDLGTDCVAFRRRGVCQYSFACRFGNDHISYSENTGKSPKKCCFIQCCACIFLVVFWYNGASLKLIKVCILF